MFFFSSFFFLSRFFLFFTPDASTWLRRPRGGEQERVCPVYSMLGVGVGEGREGRGGQIAATEV